MKPTAKDKRAFGIHVKKVMFKSGLSDGLFFEIGISRSLFYWMGAFVGLTFWLLLLSIISVVLVWIRRLQ